MASTSSNDFCFTTFGIRLSSPAAWPSGPAHKLNLTLAYCGGPLQTDFIFTRSTKTTAVNQLSQQLRALIAAAEPVLAQIDDPLSTNPLLSGGWSRKQILGHLIDSASNNHQRFVRASLQDSLDFPGYDQDASVRIQQFQLAPWAMLVTLWHSYNRLLAHVIAHLPPSHLNVQCRIGDDPPVTLEFLATDYVAHLQHHLAQMGIHPPSQPQHH